eukprot:TRINITY_DN804_c0_g1_i1.p1 TRINITY_DN804_c0_g1~~TRINITY_DN804_c0_g1_i1.p1  ORF type:complete len:112 (+),score=25.05 TRINITY_DN804_c0_g1_i1:196-531(+)
MCIRDRVSTQSTGVSSKFMASPNLRVALLSHGEECESKEDDLNSEPFVNLTKQSQRALIGVTESLCEHNMTCLMVFFADQSAIAAGSYPIRVMGDCEWRRDRPYRHQGDRA